MSELELERKKVEEAMAVVGCVVANATRIFEEDDDLVFGSEGGGYWIEDTWDPSEWVKRVA